jgi:hypothetical protein
LRGGDYKGHWEAREAKFNRCNHLYARIISGAWPLLLLPLFFALAF